MAQAGETGVQLIARLGTKPSLVGLEPNIIAEGPKPGDVTELYGEEGSGKTQMLLHFIARCILPKVWRGTPLDGLETHVLFIDTDYHFNVMRLLGILEARVLESLENSNRDQKSREAETVEQPSHEEVETLLKESLNNLHVVRCTSSAQLLVTLHSLESLIGSTPNLAVVIIDSISAFYWTDKTNGGDTTAAQERNLKRITTVLGQLVRTYNLVLFATKHAIFNRDTREQRWAGEGSHSTHRAVESPGHWEYLCKAWQRLVTRRFILAKEDSPSCLGTVQSSRTHFSIYGDSVASGTSRKKYFTIGPTGIQFCTPEEKVSEST